MTMISSHHVIVMVCHPGCKTRVITTRLRRGQRTRKQQVQEEESKQHHEENAQTDVNCQHQVLPVLYFQKDTAMNGTKGSWWEEALALGRTGSVVKIAGRKVGELVANWREEMICGESSRWRYHNVRRKFRQDGLDDFKHRSEIAKLLSRPKF